MLPFSREEFFGVFAAYNAANWPAAIIAYPLALTALLFAWRGCPQAGRASATVLALMWGWVGIVYQGLFFAAINPIAKVFAVAFIVQGVLFAYHAWARHGLEYGPRSLLRTIAGGAMILYALIFYPLIGLFAGEGYPAMPLFGAAPCPLLIFTFGLMLWASCARWWLWVIPLLWSVIGGSATILLSVPQDWALPISALVSLLVICLDRPRSALKVTPDTLSPKHRKGNANARGQSAHAGTQRDGSSRAF